LTQGSQPSEEVLAARRKWHHIGGGRPDFAVTPGPGQESVWDYPRPPIRVADPREVVIHAGHEELARTRGSVRVLETASPPTFYLPPMDVRTSLLERAPGSSDCEWKGAAVYWRLRSAPEDDGPVAWSYPDPYPEYVSIRDWLGFYPSLLDCRVDGVAVQPQPGGFYAGWVTPELVGPFKGEPGSLEW
jgi:uncharacterized protein (DUF427 family)